MRLSITGLVLAAVYLTAAGGLIAFERGETGAGNWITLRGMMSYLATFPVSRLAEVLGHKLDFQRNGDMACASLGCAGLVYGLGYFAEFIVGLIRNRS
jgi:hypothetical protein